MNEIIDQDAIPQTTFQRGVVRSIEKKEKDLPSGQHITLLNLNVHLLTGPESGQDVLISYSGDLVSASSHLAVGQQIVLSETTSPNLPPQYDFVDQYRLHNLGWLIIIFLVVAIFFGRLRGLTSILGLITSIAILGWFTIPQIINGQNALVIASISATGIAIATLYLAHGFNRRTTIALASTLLTLLFSVGLSLVFANFAHLYGTGSAEAFSLQIGSATQSINLQNLLLAGIVIGSLGILDDITTAQSAAVDELHKANSQLSRRELYKRAMSIGREHIASLINTLVLVYVGSALPIFLILKLGISQPPWILANSQFFGEELLKAVVGSLALIVAVPLTTFFASVLVIRKK